MSDLFGTLPTPAKPVPTYADRPFTLSDKITCLDREIGKRIGVYRGLVTAGKMRREKADEEIALMVAIKRDYLQCVFCGLSAADWHAPEMVAGNLRARMAVRLTEHRGLYVCQKCKPE